MASKLPYSERQWIWIAERKAEGYTTKELADFLGCSLAAARKHIRLSKDKASTALDLFSTRVLPPLVDRREEFENER